MGIHTNRTPLLLSICFQLHRDSPHQRLLNVKHDPNSKEFAYQHPTIVFLNLQKDSHLIANSLCSFFSEQPNRKFCDADPDRDFIELNLVNRLVSSILTIINSSFKKLRGLSSNAFRFPTVWFIFRRS